MTTIGKDGNNQMIPIAYVVVEAETIDSWLWFIDLLLKDLDGITEKKWAFISDQQKVIFLNTCDVFVNFFMVFVS